MKVTGARIVFVDCDPEQAHDYNRWYDLDHFPEVVASPGVVGGRRYVATKACKQARRPTSIEGLDGGKGTYCTLYLIGEDMAAARDHMGAVGQRLREQDRIFPGATAAHSQDFTLERSLVRGDLRLGEAAAPFLAHQGLLAGIAEALDTDRTDEVARWYDETHHPDILRLPGFLAIHRFSSFGVDGGPPPGAYSLNLYYLEGDPAAAVAALREAIPGLQQQGRYLPGLEEARRLAFVSPYETVTAFDYSFLERT